MSNPVFDLLNDITNGKKYRLNVDIEESDYKPFLINRGLSQHVDTIFFANEMNKCPHLSKRMQHDFLFYSVTKKKRYGKWAKGEDIDNETIELIMKRYKVSRNKALEYYQILSKSENGLEDFKKVCHTGGVA